MKHYLFLASSALVWGGAFVVGRLLVTDADPLALAWLRFVIASAAFALMEGWSRVFGRRPEAGPASDGAPMSEDETGPGERVPGWAAYALLGATGIFAYNCFFFFGLSHTGASESSLIIASSPVVVAVLSFLFLGENLGLRKVAGILLSVAGVALVVLGAAPVAGSGGDPGGLARSAGAGHWIGDLLMLGGVVSWAAYSLLGKRVLAHASPFKATSRAVWWGTLFFTVPVAVRYGGRVFSLFGPREILGLAFLGLVCTVFGFVSWYRGLVGTEVSRAAVFLNLVPVSTLTIAALTLGERPTWLQLLGGVAVLGGVWVVTMWNHKAPTGSGPGTPANP